ncbi:hypothetical protein ACWCPM_30100 [Streptomyces sp. NPDC002309]
MPTAAPPTRSAVPSTFQRGTSRAIYAVTGVVDEVADLIVPGAFARTLAARPVKTVWLALDDDAGVFSAVLPTPWDVLST